MKLYEYRSYNDYVKVQTAANKRKVDRVSAEEVVVEQIVNYVNSKMPFASFGICHGVRNAWEVVKFRDLLGFDVIGTDISDTATKFPHTIQWDFHDIKDEWVGQVDFIYSNALDHSYDPKSCVGQWVKCLSPNGLCFIEWSVMCEVPKRGLKDMSVDCFGATRSEYRSMLTSVVNVVDELEVLLDTEWVKKKGKVDLRTIFIIGA